MKIRYFILLIFLNFVLWISCSKTTEEQMREYIEFYFPSTGQYYYDIVFEWGTYAINTGPDAEEELHADSEPYRGYITMRPHINQNTNLEKLPIYLITPGGEVWITENADSIAESKSRKEITIKKTDYGTSTKTITINSSLEPIVDHYLENKDQWKKYGKLESSNGKYILKLESPEL